MALATGARIGPYEVVGSLGAGGMGEVYRARDTKLGREVALKILPDSLAGDPERLARFEREARTLASLNHPHIAQIYGFEPGPAGGPNHALVLELVEGPTLADRLAHGPIPIDDALPIARQIAEAVEAAHEAGIIHRDLKPANIKVRPDGQVKVLDFGLAKAIQQGSEIGDQGSGDAADSLRNSPTMTSPVGRTLGGVILGTAAYMSPEQAKGRAVDRRADIWAFGCVLFEMLAGRPAFDGGDITEILGAIVKMEPDWSQLPPTTPLSIVKLLHRCLQKDRAQRLRHIGDARLEIADAEAGVEDPRGSTAVTTWRPRPLTLVATVALIAGASMAAGRYLFPPATADPPELRLEIATPPTFEFRSFALSPDARLIAYVASQRGRSVLWTRRLDGTAATPIQGTDGARQPFWSPDSRSIGFFADAKLKRLDLDGGIRTLATAVNARGGTWSPRGTIVFAPSGGSALFELPADGGDSRQVTELESAPRHRFPAFLPNGDRFVFWAGRESGRVFSAALTRREPIPLLTASGSAVFLAPDTLLFEESGTLYGQRIDASSLVMTGARVAITTNIQTGQESAPASASNVGAFAYRQSTGATRQFRWLDRTGKAAASAPLLSFNDPQDGHEIELSPDGRRGAFIRSGDAQNDVWMIDLERGVASRFSTNPASEIWPLWSPSSDAIAFERGNSAIYARSLSGEERQLLSEEGSYLRPSDWSRDGRLLLIVKAPSQTGQGDIWALPLGSGEKPFPVIESRFDETRAQFSPDGRWMSYESNESGRAEIYVRPFNRPGTPVQVSPAGGIEARWHPSRQELFYIDPEANLMSVRLQANRDGSAIDASAPQILFPTSIERGGSQTSNYKFQYAVSADGTRFLINEVRQDTPPQPIIVVLNWKVPRQ